MPATEDLLYAETDRTCACCGHRDTRALTIHHIEQSKPKDESYDNKIVLCHNCHTCHHSDKGPTKGEIVDLKRRLIRKTLTQQGLNALKAAYRKGHVTAPPFAVNHLVEMQFLSYERPVHIYAADDSWIEHEEVSAIYGITEHGKQLIEKWGLNGA